MSGSDAPRQPGEGPDVPRGPESAPPVDPGSDRLRYLAAYDAQLRTEAEVADAESVDRVGPLWLATFESGRGFVTYRDLAGAHAVEVGELVRAALSHFTSRPGITEVEWKTRGHDRAPGLTQALTDHGFLPDEPEAIMIGEARLLAVDVRLPADVALRVVTDEAEVRAVSAMQDGVFGDPVSVARADTLVARIARGDPLQLWAAWARGEVVSAGRLEPVPGTSFTGIWGGATLVGWRGRGVYRALTAARARAALALGRTLIHSDSTEFSRPILERSGLVRVSTTTPYLWRR